MPDTELSGLLISTCNYDQGYTLAWMVATTYGAWTDRPLDQGSSHRSTSHKARQRKLWLEAHRRTWKLGIAGLNIATEWTPLSNRVHRKGGPGLTTNKTMNAEKMGIKSRLTNDSLSLPCIRWISTAQTLERTTHSKTQSFLDSFLSWLEFGNYKGFISFLLLLFIFLYFFLFLFLVTCT